MASSITLDKAEHSHLAALKSAAFIVKGQHVTVFFREPLLDYN